VQDSQFPSIEAARAEAIRRAAAEARAQAVVMVPGGYRVVEHGLVARTPEEVLEVIGPDEAGRQRSA
jgi:hypothetical protein